MDRGQVVARPRCHRHVVEADHTHVARHIDARIAAGIDRAHRKHVIPTAHGIDAAIAQQLFHQGKSRFMTIGVPEDDGAKRDAIQGEAFLQSLQAILGRSGSLGSAEEGDSPVTALAQHVAGEMSALDIVRADDISASGAAGPAKRLHYGHARIGALLQKLGRQSRGGDDRPIDVIFQQHLQRTIGPRAS